MRVAPIALCLGALLVGGTAVSSPRGKVVRVERRLSRATAMTFCAIMDSPEKLLCLGQAPREGEVITFLDQRAGGVTGTARAESSQPAKMYTCQGREPTIFDVNVTLTSGDRDVISRGYTSAISGVRLDDRAKVVEDYQSPLPPEQSVTVAVDSDDSGGVDLVLYQYACDAQGNVAPMGAGGANTNTQCHDTYVDRGGKLVRTHQNIVEICY